MNSDNGLKDHEIRELVNIITAKVIDTPKQQVRGVVSFATTEYLDSIGKRIDKPRPVVTCKDCGEVLTPEERKIAERICYECLDGKFRFTLSNSH